MILKRSTSFLANFDPLIVRDFIVGIDGERALYFFNNLSAFLVLGFPDIMGASIAITSGLNIDKISRICSSENTVLKSNVSFFSRQIPVGFFVFPARSTPSIFKPFTPLWAIKQLC